MKKYEDICQLPNDGRGMLPADRLKTLRQCLEGYKEKIYVLHIKKHRKLGTLEKDPDAVYQEIKSRHMKFVESNMEREMRVTAAWDNLWMGSKTTLEFEAAFEETVMELELVGLTKNQRELLLGYLQKVGPKSLEGLGIGCGSGCQLVFESAVWGLGLGLVLAPREVERPGVWCRG